MSKSKLKFKLAHPEPFIFLKGEGESAKFEIGHEAAAFLDSIEGPVGVIAIAGLYRTGKSFILNQLAGSHDGFALGATIEPCTHGIWLWHVEEGHLSEMPMMPPGATVLLLDTEGLGSYTKTETYDIQIFSFALLLSSFFVYNSMGNIDETALDRLSLVVELSKHIKTQTDADNDSVTLHSFFPTFLWLVRDFSLSLESAGRKISANEYLSNALQPAKGDAKRVQGKNQIRQCIMDFFQTRECFTLKRPVHDEATLQHLENIPDSGLRVEYLQEVAVLKEKIFTLVQPKRLYGETVNGPMLLTLARNYVEAINSGTVPTIRTAWENVVEIQCQKALQQACRSYETSLVEVVKEFGILEADDLEKVHTEIRHDTVALFRTKVVGDHTETVELELLKFIADLYDSTKRANADKSRVECERLLVNYAKPIEDEIDSGEIVSIDRLRTEWESVLSRYFSTAKGPAKFDIAVRQLQARPFEHSRKVSEALMKGAQHKFEEQLLAEKQRSATEYVRLNDLYRSVDVEWKRAQDSNKQLSDDKHALEASLKKVDHTNKELADKISELENTVRKLNLEKLATEEERSKLQIALTSLTQSDQEKDSKFTEEMLKFQEEVDKLEMERQRVVAELNQVELEKHKKKDCLIM